MGSLLSQLSVWHTVLTQDTWLLLLWAPGPVPSGPGEEVQFRSVLLSTELRRGQAEAGRGTGLRERTSAIYHERIP